MLKLYTDGAFLQSATHGGVGGVMRNEKGEFIVGFAYHKEYVTSAMHVELLAIKHGLELLQAMTVTNVIVQSDCLLAIKAICEEGENFTTLGNLVEDIKALLHQLPSIGIQYAYRTSNRVAHKFASYGFDANTHTKWFSNALEFVLDALIYDCNRMLQ
ncbi:uncharacterized protein LOC112166454 [Rosa chinensis]|uniref:uncharacterized protein LOC112166454 n=1 Tax=Rosa chinensis TaxID=74649 RepID=UPI000D087CAE|nr:uncharacterized protein LOC112166454 [Rosa chinensis]